MADTDATGRGRPRDIDHRSRPYTDRRRSRHNTNRRGRYDADRHGRHHTDRRRRIDADRRNPFDVDTDRFIRQSDTDRHKPSSNFDVRTHNEHVNNVRDKYTSRPNIIQKSRRCPHRQSYNQNVSFKPYNYGDKTICKNWDNKTGLVHNQLDVELSKHNRSSRNNFHQRNHSRGGNNSFKNSSCSVKESLTGWYSIIVTNAEEFDEKHYSDNSLRFLVDDYKVAIALHNTSRKITQRDDRKLVIKVLPYIPKRSLLSFTPVSSEVKEKIMEAMVIRYNSSTRSLDLSQFYASSLFTNNQLFVPLNRPAILLAALNMAAQYTKHDLYCLNLAKNYIYLGEGLTWIRRLFPELKVLDLSDNKLSDLNELRSLLGYTIEVLHLSRNPVCNLMDKDYYRRDIQKLFPMLIELDNLHLPPLSVVSKLKMLINLGNSYPILQYDCNLIQSNPLMTLVELFLKKYYEQYDHKLSRQTVLEAYHENATFSLSSCLLKKYNPGSLADYMPKSRNLLISNQNKNSFIFKGNANIIGILEKLPKTKHDFGSFIIDVPFASSAMIQVVVNGVFAEEFNENHNYQVFRSFCRTFCLVPAVNGWIILSDMMFVTLVTSELATESTKRFYIFKPTMTDNTCNRNSLQTTIEDTLPDVLSTLVFKTAIPNCSSSISHLFKQLSPPSSPKKPQHTLDSQSNFQSSVIQNSQSSDQQQNHPTTATADILLNSQQLNSSCPISNSKLPFPIPNTKPIETTSTQMHLNSSSNHIENSNNELLMIKRFSKESGMNDKWSKKCLVENNWDFSKATLCYLKLKSNIPSVAYKH
ncbi:PREDICTED: nuclear RNA export factor 1-like isoform X2 [Diuraphis noxia]|uniref:nuclear RNA export factor 1-like isoform X2 n=1 Tax=Diuraphis noxia TaxID=143948 RepID=UPI000763A928|nr:PREDICTED: nuclear RNA export factor 1-like isoform X2 [Diuraphis noxia]